MIKMDNVTEKSLIKRIELLSDLLKKHEAIKKEHELASSSVRQLPKNSSWRQQSLSAYKMVKDSSRQLTFPNKKYPVNKFHQSGITNRNTGTVLYSNINRFKSKHKLTPSKAVRNINTPSNNVIFQRAILSKDSLAQCKKTIICPENTSDKALGISGTIGKGSSNSQGLIKEIESLTRVLKKTSENKSKIINKTVKDSSSVQDKLLNCKISSKNFKYCAFNKCNVLKNDSLFSKNSDLTKLKIVGRNSSAIVDKRSGSCYSDFSFANKNKQMSRFNHANSLKLDKYCYKSIDMKNISNCKAISTPLKTVGNEEKSRNTVQKSISESCIQKVSCQDDLSCDLPEIKSKLFSQDNKLIRKLNVTHEPYKSGAKINTYPNITFKSPNICKSSGMPKINSTDSKYRRINAVHSATSNKNLNLKKSSHHRTLSINKKTKRKVNTKFKVINKTVTPHASNRKVILLSDSGSKENSPLTVDESDPLFKLLNDSTVDKLEQDLLAISTMLTATPTSTSNDDKVLQTSFGKINSKPSLKKMPLKRSKSRISKYKFVSSVASQNSALKNRHNFLNLKNVKKINTKFRLVNKHTQPVPVTPLKQGKSILVKRLFKSKNTIINKNVSPTNHSAKMIKSKYFALNKRKLPNEKPVLYPKVPLSQPKFKGYLSAKLYSKKHRYQQNIVLAYRQRLIRRFPHYRCHTFNNQFNKSITRNKCKKKLHNGYGHSPVVFIQGVKYSLNLSGKTLRKLPAQDLTKIHRKMVTNGRGCTRTPENKMKAVIPISTNLASRVLHRSITRVLSATSKKKLTKVNTYCMFYNRFGRCNKGVKCTYIHDPSKIAVCTRFLRGTCKVDGCPFSHEISPGKMAICSFFLVGACDKDHCPYRHEKLSPNAELCKAFVQGYCPNGKECNKAHILICPKYIQGNCEKGTSCAFPHPPQKPKKNVQKEINEEVQKPDDALLEKVARYFQSEDTSLPCDNRSDESNVENQFVPKQRRLEEQPSFIPLCDDNSS